MGDTELQPDEFAMAEMPLPDGLYDLLATNSILDAVERSEFSQIDEVQSQRLAELLSDVVTENLPKLLAVSNPAERIDISNRLLQLLKIDESIAEPKVLRAVRNSAHSDERVTDAIPALPLSDLALLTNAKSEPNMSAQLRKELMSADSVDILMAFVMKPGVALIAEQLAALRDRGVKVRMLTGVYRGATDQEAIDMLVKEFGVEVKINYETHSNHLHAKAWLIRRNSGFSTAFIGSSNLSRSAFIDGMEWNVRLTDRRSPHVMAKFQTEFNSYWSNEAYRAYSPDINGDELRGALVAAGGTSNESSFTNFHFLDVQPRLHQERMLTALEVERNTHGFHKNLVVAATGTGKTLLAAFDYKRLRSKRDNKYRILFVAHRERILRQSRDAFAAVLGESSFGELLVGGQTPKEWNHVFASVQTLNSRGVENFKKDQFDMIVIDEFHHAEANTYRKILDHFEPDELLGLTATPERADGVRVQDEFFAGRIAAEIRLWEALDLQLLTPFTYFGIGDSTDFSKIEWKSGGYDKSALSAAVTGNDVRDRLVLQELKRKISDTQKMKSLVFCVTVDHANHIAAMLNKAGISSEVVDGGTAESLREGAISKLSKGELQAIVTVDVFNEGIDIPAVDTLIMLRPTESPVVFLQQLGRGLRLADGKDTVTVFDFVGVHRAEYRSDLRLEAMTGVPRGKLEKAIAEGFPLLPSGVSIVLDKMSRDHVLLNLKNQVSPVRKVLISEIKQYAATVPRKEISFRGFIDATGRTVGEIYRVDPWTKLAADAGIYPVEELTDIEIKLLGRLNRFMHVDDPERVDIYSQIISGAISDWSDCDEFTRRTRAMFHWLVWPDNKDSSSNVMETYEAAEGMWAAAPLARAELIDLLAMNENENRLESLPVNAKSADLPLEIGKRYAREEILGAIQWASLEKRPIQGNEPGRVAHGMQSGVCFVPEIDLDCFFVTLNKVEGDFSPSTRYRDYAESREVFHWESQNVDHENTTQGRRYLAQRRNGGEVLIAIREFAKDEFGKTAPFFIAGLADYIRHEGSKPLKIWWELREPMNPDLYRMASAVRVA